MLFRIFTVVAIAALAISTWFLTSRHPIAPEGGTARPVELPGYYLKDTVLTDYDCTGAPSVRIKADHIDQIAHGNEIALRQVRIDYQGPSGTDWYLVGDLAHVQPGGREIDIRGNVRLQGVATGRGAEALITTDSLSYHVADAIARSDSDVHIDFAGQTLNAHGLTANLKERTLRLESSVNGRFHP